MASGPDCPHPKRVLGKHAQSVVQAELGPACRHYETGVAPRRLVLQLRLALPKEQLSKKGWKWTRVSCLPQALQARETKQILRCLQASSPRIWQA